MLVMSRQISPLQGNVTVQNCDLQHCPLSETPSLYTLAIRYLYFNNTSRWTST
uniref:Uncharacterized protein n=1 Tax=Anguilla anguilla TaxID=7936 RepID=A0A0E9U332_ANGAN